MKKRKGKGRKVRKEIDFSNGVRGKYAARLKDTIAVVLEPDVAPHFPDGETVNAILRKHAGLPTPRKRKK
jgi:hypothetical protein